MINEKVIIIFALIILGFLGGLFLGSVLGPPCTPCYNRIEVKEIIREPTYDEVYSFALDLVKESDNFKKELWRIK